MPFAEKSLEEIVTPKLQFHGPLTLKELGITNYEANAHRLNLVYVSGHFRSHVSFPIKDLFPGLGKETLCFLSSQMQELGLRIGRVIPQNKSEGFYSAITRLLNDLFEKSRPKALAAMRLHYLREEDINNPTKIYGRRGALFGLLSRSDVGYLAHTGYGCGWTSRGIYALAKVFENQRQAEDIDELNKKRKAFLQQDRNWSYEQVTQKLGWASEDAQKYLELAQAASQQLKVYVIGTSWQRLFAFEDRGGKLISRPAVERLA